MLNTQELKANWSSIRGKVREKWGQLTDDDLDIAAGNVEQMVGAIQRRTGETRSQIENFLNDLLRQPAVARAVDTAQEYAHEAADRVREGYRRAESMIQEYPAPSVASAFVGGLVTGVLIGLVLSK